jgi:formylglycine-generating enzyme required for sulfatase activity
MRRALWLLLVGVAFCAAGCSTGAPPATPAPEDKATATQPVSVPTVMEVLPTNTPVPPPPTPLPTATPEPAPSPTAAAGVSPEPTQAPAPAAAPMIAIPAGEFTMGLDSGDDDEKPAHTVFVDAFEIDRFEVTNEQFQAFVEQTGYATDAEKAGEGMTWRTFAQDKPQHPVVVVSWNDAVAFCEWSGKRLPTEAEWEKAARGTEGFIYPWGNEWALGLANTEEAGHRGTTIVGSFPSGASPYGVMDMAGNVSEWTSDWYEAYPGSSFQSSYFGQQFRVIRGGGWFSDEHLVRTTERSCSCESLHNDDVGFRCVR